MTEIDWDRPRCRHCGQPSRVRAVLALSGRCAALVDDGRVVTGCNVENASYGANSLCRVRAGFGAPCAVAAAGRFRLRRRSGIRPDAVRPLPSAALGAWRVRMPADTPAGILPMSAVLPQAFGRDELARGRHEP